MQRIFVLDSKKRPLMPCHPAKARKLLDKGKAAVYRLYPFTIILNDEVEADNQEIALKIDPGSPTTGLALVADFEGGKQVILAADLEHRGQHIRDALLKRRQLRRGRRSRKTRYRPARFDNRRRPKGWLPPSLMSRVDNILTWLNRLERYAPISSLSMELVRFDTQLMENPEISGIEYQQGEIQGYEVREYLLNKWNRTCAYCGIQNVPLEVEHIIPKVRGGSNRVSNLALACRPCNQEKGSQTAEEYGFPAIQAKAKRPLKDAAAVNATRWELYRRLTETGYALETGTGGRTKYNRRQQGYPKAHWIDAACIGESGAYIDISTRLQPLHIKAMGRGTRQMCRMNKYGFPRTSPKGAKRVKGFQTGDMVRAVVPAGKKQGTHIGRVAVRLTGSFRVGTVDGINTKYCTLIQQGDGYDFMFSSAIG